MENYKTEILNEVKILLGLNDDEKDDILSVIIESTVNYCLAYCRLEVLPYQLYGIIAQMCVQSYNAEGVKSIWEGDRKIEYSADFTDKLKPFVCRRGFVPSERNCDDKSV